MGIKYNMLSYMSCQDNICNELKVINGTVTPFGEYPENEYQYWEMSHNENSLGCTIPHSRQGWNHSPFMAAHGIKLMGEHEC